MTGPTIVWFRQDLRATQALAEAGVIVDHAAARRRACAAFADLRRAS